MLGKTAKDQEHPKSSPETRPEGVSVISKEMHITGDCSSRGPLRVEGRISGNVTASGVAVLASGIVEGDIDASEGGDASHPFVVEGRVAGTVRATFVRVGPRGSVEGGVHADEAEIHGKVSGGVVARRRLALEKTAKVMGDVYARRLALQEGGLVNGTIRMGDQVPTDAAPEPSGEEADSKRPESVSAA